jgi:hypothetical protein
VIQLFEWDGDKAMPKNKYGIPFCYHKTYKRIVAAGTYLEDHITCVDVTVATGVAIATATATVTANVRVGVSVSFSTADVGGTGVLCSLNTATVAQPVATADAA